MSPDASLHYLTDDNGNAVAVVVPMEVWREIESERETAYLLKSDAMKRRLLEATSRTDGLSLDDARAKFVI
jgi:PHD/YefM family antitoxin component YafN of YafNO toxin-antitoxin module